MFESIFAVGMETVITFPGLSASICTAFILGFIVSFVYSRTQKGKRKLSQSFIITLVMLPAVVTVIILLVGNNVARAFSLAGAFSIIRFRSAPGDAKDITYVLFAMAIGLAAGMGFILYSVIVGLALCLVISLLEFFKYGLPKSRELMLKITVPEDLDFPNAFDGVLEKYTASANLRRIKTADLGSLYELCYGVTVKDGVNEKDFIDELRCRNGNLNITLILEPQENSEL
jgi:hypothetical protein